MVDQGDQGTSEENPPVWDGCIKPFKKWGYLPYQLKISGFFFHQQYGNGSGKMRQCS